MWALLCGVLLASIGMGVLLAIFKQWSGGNLANDSLDWYVSTRWLGLGLLVGALLLVTGIALLQRGWSVLF